MFADMHTKVGAAYIAAVAVLVLAMNLAHHVG